MSAASPPVGRTSSPEEAALSTAQGGLCAKRQSFRVSCGRRERSCGTERAPQWDGRFSSYFSLQTKTICPTQACTTPDVCIIAHLLIEGYSFEYVNAYHSVSRAEPRADVRELDESVSSPVRRVAEVAPGACPVSADGDDA